MAYRMVYLRIRCNCYNSGYGKDSGWVSDTAQAAFKEESRRIFHELGWDLHTGRNGVCDTVMKGHQEFYLHPMAVKIFKDRLRHAELFGKPVLTTSGIIPRETVPDGWFCYYMQVTGRNPDARAALVDYAAFGHRGSILSPTPLKRPSTASRRMTTFSAVRKWI